MTNIVTRQQAITHKRPGVLGRYYQFPAINGGTTVAYAEFSGEHGQRTIGDKARIYYILDGEGELELNGIKYPLSKNSVITIPPHATYNLWPNSGKIKVILITELLDLSLLPK